MSVVMGNMAFCCRNASPRTCKLVRVDGKVTRAKYKATDNLDFTQNLRVM